MSFSTQSNAGNRSYDNADSFAMAFDEAWKRVEVEAKNNSSSKEEKVKKVLEVIKDHPFLKSSPQQAKNVATFRIKLLNLS